MSLMVALHYLKSRYDLSDEVVLAQWVENLSWQHFSGMQFLCMRCRSSARA
jgi:hypothetical protein